MPRFHLNVFNDDVSLDPDGIDRPDLKAAKHEAVRGARALIADDVIAGRPVHQSHRVEITDQNGNVLDIVRFGDMVELQP